MKKSKLLKTISFSSLALLMGMVGTMAFAPLGTTAPLTSASTMDQINTKADGENIKYAPSALGLDPENDPVIYTTESGLEIKWGNASTTALGGGNEEGTVVPELLLTGNLKDYPYFTTTNGSITYNWVIIGHNLTPGPEYQKLSYWQTNKSISATYEYFFDSVYETTNPAGSAIKDNILNDYTARNLISISTSLLTSVTKNTTEIPEGCVLVLAEKILFTATYSNSGNGLTDAQIEDLNLPSNVLNYIKSVNIQCYTGWTSPTYYNATFRFFYLSNNYQFRHATYLTSTNLKIAYNSTGTASSWWLRDHNSGSTRQSVTATGGTANSNGTCGVRPAFCLKLC